MDEFVKMSEEAKDLWVPRNIPQVETEVDPLSFYRDYVGRNIPLIIRGGCRHWPALEKWKRKEYLIESVPGEVTVAMSPEGIADAVINVDGESLFVLPHEKLMKLEDVFVHLEEKRLPVAYCQKQCSSLTEEYPDLIKDVPEIDWASKAFGQQPDAINMWIGDSRAISSLHKDPYENIYGCVSGRKEFILFPPTDLPFLYRQKYQVGQFDENMNVKKLLDFPETPWIPIRPDNPDYSQYPLFKHATPLKVVLYPGDLLYLPSLWFHQVSQSDNTIAVNFWYDMKFDARFTWTLFQDYLLLK